MVTESSRSSAVQSTMATPKMSNSSQGKEFDPFQSQKTAVEESSQNKVMSSFGLAGKYDLLKCFLLNIIQSNFRVMYLGILLNEYNFSTT